MDILAVMMAARHIIGKIPLLSSAAKDATDAAEQAAAAAQEANEAAKQVQLLNMGLSVVDGQLNVTYGSDDESSSSEEPANDEE